MTINRAIELIQMMMDEYEENESIDCEISIDDESLEALRFARDFMKNKENLFVPDTDCISRQTIIDKCRNVIENGISNEIGEHPITAECILKDTLDLPSVYPGKEIV